MHAAMAVDWCWALHALIKQVCGMRIAAQGSVICSCDIQRCSIKSPFAAASCIMQSATLRRNTFTRLPHLKAGHLTCIGRQSWRSASVQPLLQPQHRVFPANHTARPVPEPVVKQFCRELQLYHGFSVAWGRHVRADLSFDTLQACIKAHISQAAAPRLGVLPLLGCSL